MFTRKAINWRQIMPSILPITLGNSERREENRMRLPKIVRVPFPGFPEFFRSRVPLRQKNSNALHKKGEWELVRKFHSRDVDLIHLIPSSLSSFKAPKGQQTGTIREKIKVQTDVVMILARVAPSVANFANMVQSQAVT